MATLVFDIETAGEQFEDLDPVSQHLLENRFKRKSKTEEEAEQAKETLAFYPPIAQIVAIGMVEADTGKANVLFQNKSPEEPFEENNIFYQPVESEKQMLEEFWKKIIKFDTFVTFNGRGFDIPFLMIRSAINNIRPSKNLMINRYSENQPINLKHIDLADQLGFYGAKDDRLGLHFWARAFGITSSKLDELTGDKVTDYFRQGKCREIAKYCMRDVFVTLQIYKKWDQYLRFF